MSREVTSRREDLLLSLTAYLTLAAVAVLGLSMPRQTGERWITAGLLLGFGILLARTPDMHTPGRQSHLYLAAQTTLVVGLLALGPISLFLLLYFLLSAQVMLLLPQRTAALWIGVFVLITSGAFVYAEGWPDGLLMLLPYTGGYLFFAAFAHSLARADAARRESQALLDELQVAHRQLQEYATQVEELAVAEERNRLAREMHDTLGHRLTVAAVQLEGAQRLIPSDPERAAGMVGTVREQVREALSELRRVVAALRAPLEADLSLSHALSRLATGFQEATCITVHLMLPEEMPALPDAHRLALYRAAQEALTNVQRHAQAQDVWLQLTWQEGAVKLLVSDNGTGLSAGVEQTGFGLRGLQERVALLGGELYLESRPGGGTQVSFYLPLPGAGNDG